MGLDTPPLLALKYFFFFVDTNLNSWVYTKKCLSLVKITIKIDNIVTIVNSKPNIVQQTHDKELPSNSLQKVPNLNNINQILFLIIHQVLFLPKIRPMCI